MSAGAGCKPQDVRVPIVVDVSCETCKATLIAKDFIVKGLILEILENIKAKDIEFGENSFWQCFRKEGVSGGFQQGGVRFG